MVMIDIINILSDQILHIITIISICLFSRLKKKTDNAMQCKDDMCFLKGPMGADSTISQEYFNYSSTSKHQTNTFLLWICFANAVIGEASGNKIPDDERDKISALSIDIVIDPKIWFCDILMDPFLQYMRSTPGCIWGHGKGREIIFPIEFKLSA